MEKSPNSCWIWPALALLFAVYFSVAWWALADPYEIDGPPSWAGIRVPLNPPFAQWPDSPFAATVRDRKGLFGNMVKPERLELWEDDQRLGPGRSTVRAITEQGNGRYLI